eukprot:3006647-Pleurochrysis_carterae.AAC.4
MGRTWRWRRRHARAASRDKTGMRGRCARALTALHHGSREVHVHAGLQAKGGCGRARRRDHAIGGLRSGARPQGLRCTRVYARRRRTRAGEHILGKKLASTRAR